MVALKGGGYPLRFPVTDVGFDSVEKKFIALKPSSSLSIKLVRSFQQDLSQGFGKQRNFETHPYRHIWIRRFHNSCVVSWKYGVVSRTFLEGKGPHCHYFRGCLACVRGFCNLHVEQLVLCLFCWDMSINKTSRWGCEGVKWHQQTSDIPWNSEFFRESGVIQNGYFEGSISWPWETH